MCQYIHTVYGPCNHCDLSLRICSGPKKPLPMPQSSVGKKDESRSSMAPPRPLSKTCDRIIHEPNTYSDRRSCPKCANNEPRSMLQHAHSVRPTDATKTMWSDAPLWVMKSGELGGFAPPKTEAPKTTLPKAETTKVEKASPWKTVTGKSAPWRASSGISSAEVPPFVPKMMQNQPDVNDPSWKKAIEAARKAMQAASSKEKVSKENVPKEGKSKAGKSKEGKSNEGESKEGAPKGKESVRLTLADLAYPPDSKSSYWKRGQLPSSWKKTN